MLSQTVDHEEKAMFFCWNLVFDFSVVFYGWQAPMQNRFGDDMTFEERYRFKEHGSDMRKQFTAREFKKNF